MADLTGKVAFITGAARGQGRAHAVELAKAGADIIAVDVADANAAFGLGYPLGTAEELADTAKAVEALDRRVVTAEVDVRNADALTDALQRGVSELGRLDIVIANAGIAPGPTPIQDTTLESWSQVLDVNLTGVFNTCKAAIPHPPPNRGRRGHGPDQLDRRLLHPRRARALQRGQGRRLRIDEDVGEGARTRLDPGEHGAPLAGGHSDDHE